MSWQKNLRQAIDPAHFVSTQFGFTPDRWQTDVLRNRDRQVVLNCSRQSGKSTIGAYLVVHEAIFFPGSQILIISPTQNQSDELFRKVRDVFKNSGLKFRLIEDNQRSLKLDNGSRVLSLPADPERIRGYSPNLIVVDEAAGVPDNVFEAIRPMFTVSLGRLVLLSTPLGKRGYFHRICTNNDPDWIRFTITADMVKRISEEFLRRERRELGDIVFNQEFMCKFVDDASSLFSFDDVTRAITREIEPLLQESDAGILINQSYLYKTVEDKKPKYFIAVDPGKTRSYTGIIIIEKIGSSEDPIFNVVYIARLSHGTEYLEQVEIIENLLNVVEPLKRCKLVIDCSGVGAVLYEHLKKRGIRPGGIIFKPRGEARQDKEKVFKVSKEELFKNAQKKIALGEVRIAEGCELLNELVYELNEIEVRLTEHGNYIYKPRRSGIHDDLVDAFCIGLWYAEHGGYAEGGVLFLEIDRPPFGNPWSIFR